MKLLLKGENGNTVSVTVYQSDSFLDIQKRLAEEHGIDIDIQNFSVEGKPIENDLNVLSYFQSQSSKDIDLDDAETTQLENQVCRLCGEIFDCNSLLNILQVKSKIIECLQIDVDANNHLSNMVCLLCVEKLEEFQNFVKTCSEAEKKQWEIIKDHQDNCPFCSNEDINSIIFVSPLDFTETSNKHKNFCLKPSDNHELITTELSEDNTTVFCPICQKIVAISECVLGKCHESGVLCCFVCELTFEDSYKFKEHLKSHLSEVNNSQSSDQSFTWKCQICDVSLPNSEAFKDHLKTHKASPDSSQKNSDETETAKLRKNLYCDMCSKSFRCKRRLEFHIEFHLKGSKAGLCVLCRKEFTSELYLYKHMLHNHLNKKIFTCELCGKGFKNKSSLTYHSRSHESFEAMRPFSCSICNKRFVRKNTLRDHMMTHHGKGMDPGHGTCFQCKVCKEAFPNTNSSISHMEIHHPNQVNDKEGYSFDMQTVNKLFICEFCDKCYSLANDLIEHRLGHSPPLQYQCKMCNEEFGSFIEMRTHLDDHVNDGMTEYKAEFEVPMLFICEYCEKCFRNYHSFSTHTSAHSGDKPYTCRFCPETFSSYEDILKHRIAHQNIENHSFQSSNILRPFECLYCKKAFTSNSSLTKHIRIHTGEKPFQCEICNKSFTQSSGLHTHYKVHSNDRPYQCDLCTKSYKSLGDYKNHVRRHSGLRPFTCNVCSKSFASQRSFKHHVKNH